MADRLFGLLMWLAVFTLIAIPGIPLMLLWVVIVKLLWHLFGAV
jgi:hypothetical protein